MASRQTATIATSCSIWPHEILAFTTSTFPSFYSSYILAHFQVFTVQSNATQLTTLCRMKVFIWVTLPVCYFHYRLFLSWIGRGERSDVFVWVFLRGHASIHCSKWEGHDLFRKKIPKYLGPSPPLPSPPIKKRTFPKKIEILRRVYNRGPETYLEWNEELLPTINIIYFPRPSLPWPTIRLS